MRDKDLGHCVAELNVVGQDITVPEQRERLALVKLYQENGLVVKAGIKGGTRQCESEGGCGGVRVYACACCVLCGVHLRGRERVCVCVRARACVVVVVVVGQHRAWQNKEAEEKRFWWLRW